jgi:hypothetical protein
MRPRHFHRPPGRQAALHLAGRYCTSRGDDEVGVVITGIDAVRPEVDDFVSRLSEMRNQIFL